MKICLTSKNWLISANGFTRICTPLSETITFGSPYRYNVPTNASVTVCSRDLQGNQLYKFSKGAYDEENPPIPFRCLRQWTEQVGMDGFPRPKGGRGLPQWSGIVLVVLLVAVIPNTTVTIIFNVLPH